LTQLVSKYSHLSHTHARARARAGIHNRMCLSYFRRTDADCECDKRQSGEGVLEQVRSASAQEGGAGAVVLAVVCGVEAGVSQACQSVCESVANARRCDPQRVCWRDERQRDVHSVGHSGRLLLFVASIERGQCPSNGILRQLFEQIRRSGLVTGSKVDGSSVYRS
jgi:hypothetical protein